MALKLSRLKLCNEICRLAHITRKDMRREDLSKRELVWVHLYLVTALDMMAQHGLTAVPKMPPLPPTIRGIRKPNVSTDEVIF